MKDHNLSTFLSVRVSPETRQKFHDKAAEIGNSSDLLREIVEAFIEDRLVIQLSDSKRNLYHVRAED
jgi:predicted DNA-binding protein